MTPTATESDSDTFLSNALCAQFDKLFDFPVSVTVLAVADRSAELLGAEVSSTASMADSRLADFSTGRVAARLALGRLGLQATELPIGNQRQVVWPEGVCGSISHSGGMAVSVVTNSPEILSLGIDLESLSVLDHDVSKLVCTAGELANIAQYATESSSGLRRQEMPELDPGEIACLIFSIKESIFKCLHPVFNVWIDFQQADVTLDLDAQSYSVTLDSALDFNRVGMPLTGRFAVRETFVLSASSLGVTAG